MDDMPAALALLLLLLMLWKSTRRARFVGSKMLVDMMVLHKESLDVLNLADNIRVQSHICSSTCLIDRRHRTHCVAKIDGNRWRIVGTKFGHLVRGIDNHLGLLDEWQTKDGVDGDIMFRCNKKACGVPLLHEVRKGW
jgi:hypothetical protein